MKLVVFVVVVGRIFRFNNVTAVLPPFQWYLQVYLRFNKKSSDFTNLGSLVCRNPALRVHLGIIFTTA